MRWDMRKFKGPGEGGQESGWFLFVRGSVVVLLW